ncbi:sensor histidine kinase [Stackebrandtia nassauensis]|nr:histidine kinase [Stackebrandtia nassauensis]
MLTSDRVHRLGGFLIRMCLVGFLGLVWLVESLAVVQDAEYSLDRLFVGMACLVSGLVAMAVVLFAEGHLPQWALPAGGLSILVTAGCFVIDGGQAKPGFAETGALIILVAWTSRRFDAPRGKLATGLLIVALLLMPLRLTQGVRQGVAFEFLIVMSIAAALALGAYLYSVDARRRRAIATVRHGERLELARELHDFVAHHVTGIVVQAQAAQYITQDDPARARESFGAIEKAGLEALTSMRRLVDVMRQDDSGAGARPLGDLGQTAELVDRFRHGDAIATLYVSPELTPETLAPETAASVHRIVQEGLTNVRKHAAGVSAVTVAVAAVNSGVEVTVRDDGGPATGSRLSAVGGGFGLEGLHERATAIGGRLRAGPRPEGGWEVVATLPLRSP